MKSHHPFTWTTADLDDCWLLEITREDNVLALVWFSRVAPGVIECHACAAPSERGRWLSRDLIATMAGTIAETAACHTIIAQVTSPLTERIWRCLGFTIVGRCAMLTIEG